MEIERKWLVDDFPDSEGLTLKKHSQVEQGYICTEPVVRIRRSVTSGGESYVLCFKGKGTLVREEIETDISRETFEKLAAFIGVPLVTKDFKVYALADGHSLEVSCVDKGLPTQFFYAEVEFDTVEDAHAFVPPAYLGAEKTEDSGFSMSRYWLQTRIKKD